MHLIMYLRKSREDLEKERFTGEDTLNSHRERLTKFCLDNGHTWTERAEVVSGDTIAGRPVFQNVLTSDMPSGLYQGILVTEIARLGRGDMEDAGRIYKALINHAFPVLTPSKTYNPLNQSDLRQIRFELFLSREEYELIKNRLWDARVAKAEKGYAPNFLPTFGYDQHKGQLKPNPDDARLVLKAFDMRADGSSLQEIADHFNHLGAITKRGTKFHGTTINKMLRNVNYIGKMRFRGEIIGGQHEPIIPLGLWQKVQKINDSLTPNQTLRRDNFYLVQLYCHDCGCRMYGEASRWNKIYSVYSCSGRKHGFKHYHVAPLKEVHKEVFEQLRLIATDPDVLEQIAKEREQIYKIDKQTIISRLEDTKRQLREKEILLRRLGNDYIKGDLAAAIYTKLFERTQNDISKLRVDATRLERESESAVELTKPQEITSRLSSLLAQWDNLPNKERKQIIPLFLSRIERDKAGNYYFRRVLPLCL
jgi:site-specific DNA recombinase